MFQGSIEAVILLYIQRKQENVYISMRTAFAVQMLTSTLQAAFCDLFKSRTMAS